MNSCEKGKRADVNQTAVPCNILFWNTLHAKNIYFTCVPSRKGARNPGGDVKQQMMKTLVKNSTHFVIVSLCTCNACVTSPDALESFFLHVRHFKCFAFWC